MLKSTRVLKPSWFETLSGSAESLFPQIIPSPRTVSEERRSTMFHLPWFKMTSMCPANSRLIVLRFQVASFFSIDVEDGAAW